MNKRVLVVLMSLMMVIGLAGCGASTASSETTGGDQDDTAKTEAAAENTAEAGDDWYKAVLEDPEVKAQYPYCRLLDVDLDGVDELFLSTTEDYFIGDGEKACLMANVNGEATTLQEIGGAGGEYWIPSQSDATLVYFSRLSGEGHLVLYQIVDGSLKETTTVDYYAQNHGPNGGDEEMYMQDGKEISSEEGESFWEQYGNSDGAITYEKY